jgi:hypothetical protein
MYIDSIDHRIIIELLLRFYGRQMITSQTNKVNNCSNETILNNYFIETNLKEQGLPALSFF